MRRSKRLLRSGVGRTSSARWLTVLLVVLLVATVAIPASAVVYFRTGTVECSPSQGLGTRAYAVEDHYHYKSGQGIDWTLPGGVYWWLPRLVPTGGPLQSWKVGNLPPFNHSYSGSYGYCG